MSDETKKEIAIATLNDTQIEQVTVNDFPLTREQREMQRELLQVEAELEFISLDMLNSRDVLHVPITVTDAVFRTIKDSETKADKQCVSFVCINQETGEPFTCLKGSNAFNDTYVKFFDLWRGQGRILPDMNFVEEPKFKRAGNAAIILRRVPKVIGAGVASTSKK